MNDLQDLLIVNHVTEDELEDCMNPHRENSTRAGGISGRSASDGDLSHYESNSMETKVEIYHSKWADPDDGCDCI